MIYLIEIEAYDDTVSPAVTRTLRYATGGGKVTKPSETPANTFYEPRVMEPVNFTRSAFSGGRLSGGASVGSGEVVLNNADQALAALLDYGIDGRAVTVRVGEQNAAYPAGYTTFLSGTAEQVEVTSRQAVIRLRDRLATLQLPLQETKYLGNNSLPSGKEGVAGDIKGRPKPLAYGRCYQVPLVCVNTSKLIYQAHDGALQAVDSVYDRGVALTPGTNRADLAAMEATAPAAGAYDTCLAEGLIRLGAAPTGAITADVRGDATGSYVNTVGGIVRRILETKCGASAGDIDSAAFSALDSAAPQEVGLWIGSETSRQAAIDQLTQSVGAWLAPSRTGLWQMGRLAAPSGTAATEFTDVDIISIERQATRDAERGVPVYRVKLEYRRFWEVFSDDGIAGSVTAAFREELKREYRSVVETDATVQTKHLLAPEMSRSTLLVDATDAATEAARLLTLHKARRDFVRLTVQFDASTASLDLGGVVSVRTRRLGYDAGRLMVVVGITSDGRAGRLTLDLWG